MSVRPNVLTGRREIVETNSGNAIDKFVLTDPLLIYKARLFREGTQLLALEFVQVHQVTNRNPYNYTKNRALESVGRFTHIGAQEQMTSDCPDGYCKEKIQAVDHAIGHDKNEWATLLDETSSYDDVKQALRFCEIFKLEAKVCVLDEGFSVQVRNEVMHDLRKLSSKIGYGNLYDE